MPVRVLLIVLIVLFIVLLFAADRAVKAIRRGRRRADANKRLVAAVDRGKAKYRQRRAAAEASRALTSVIPTIHDHPTRHPDDPADPADHPQATPPDTSTNPLPISTVPRVP
jgi:type II secretory pathway pseudopilin PulG